MAASQGSESGIDWELERQLAARGYGYDDTDASDLAAEYLNVADRFDAFHLPSDEVQLPSEEVEPSLSRMSKTGMKSESAQAPKGVSRGRGLYRQSRDAITAELAGREGYSDVFGDRNETLPATGRGKISRSREIVQPVILPGTPDTSSPEAQSVFLSRTRNPRLKPREVRVDSPAVAGTRKPIALHQRREVKRATPQHFTWHDTEEFKVARQVHGSEAYRMFPPKPPSNIKKDEIVRPTVWKSPPVAPLTDYRCREQLTTRATSSVSRCLSATHRDLATAEEKRKAAISTLPDEPPAGDGVITIAVKLPSGKRTSRRFLKTDSLRILKSWIWSQEDAPINFQVYTNCPRRILPCTPSSANPVVDTFEDVGIITNEILHVEAFK